MWFFLVPFKKSYLVVELKNIHSYVIPPPSPLFETELIVVRGWSFTILFQCVCVCVHVCLCAMGVKRNMGPRIWVVWKLCYWMPTKMTSHINYQDPLSIHRCVFCVHLALRYNKGAVYHFIWSVPFSVCGICTSHCYLLPFISSSLFLCFLYI